MKNNVVVTIERLYGSGGRETGQRVASILGIQSYDHELIDMAAKRSGMNSEMLYNADEKATNSFLYSLALGAASHGSSMFGFDVPINDKLFMTQSEIIKELSQKESCVIVGRSADYILRDYPYLLSVFIYASEESRMSRISQRQSCTLNNAKDLMNKTDKRRINYYNFYTGKKWGKVDSYHLSIDSTILGVEGTARVIAEMALNLDNKS